MAIAEPIARYLSRERAPYSTFVHERAYTAQREAEVAHVPGRRWAKSVACFADDEPLLAVVPADHIVDLKMLRQLTGAQVIRLASEDECAALYPECEAGAMPPFGSLFGQRTFVDTTLAGEEELVFNGGTYSDAIRMDYADFAGVEKPFVGAFAVWH